MMVRRNVQHSSWGFLNFFLEGVSTNFLSEKRNTARVIFNRRRRRRLGHIETERFVLRRDKVMMIIGHGIGGVDGRGREGRDIVRGQIVRRNTISGWK